MKNAKAFLEDIAKAIVSTPDEVEVQSKVDEMGVLLTLTVAKEDMGIVIGREGATAKAIRNLVKIVGMKENARVNVKILEPNGDNSSRY